jgi:hypothetical protein
MINKLILLAEILDRHNHKQAADFVDKLIKSAAENDDEWVDEPTRVGAEPTPLMVPPLDPDALELNDADGMELVAKLRSVLRSLPNPDQWTNNECAAIEHMAKGLLGVVRVRSEALR